MPNQRQFVNRQGFVRCDDNSLIIGRIDTIFFRLRFTARHSNISEKNNRLVVACYFPSDDRNLLTVDIDIDDVAILVTLIYNYLVCICGILQTLLIFL